MTDSALSPDQRQRDHLSPQEFAQQSGLSLSTVHRYLKAGHLPKLQLAGPRGRVLIPRSALASIQEQASVPPVPRPATANKPSSPKLSGPTPKWLKH